MAQPNPAAVAEIRKRMPDASSNAPNIGDFHYNGHVQLMKYPECAKALDPCRMHPGKAG